ncbi:MAG: Fur family transcriptional regulator [Gemmataceae bacterium]
MTLPAIDVSQSPEEKFREYLASRPKPQRFTTQQHDLLQHIFAKHSHFDADQLIHEIQQTQARVSRATIYRTLAKLVDAGLLRKIELGSRTVYDHDYGYPWHEHLVCDSCNSITEFQDPQIEAALARVAADHQFRAAGHTLVVRGICGKCNAAQAASRRPYGL